MADLFISWGTPDKRAVVDLVQRIRDAGLDCFEYTDAMRAGDKIPERVLGEIHQAKLALLCMSQETVGREWLQRELHWCYSDLVDEQRPMRALLPIQVGKLGVRKIPRLIRDSSLFVFDLSKPARREANLIRLLADIQAKLGAPAPVAIPATIFAMKRRECQALINRPETIRQLRGLSETAGMRWDGSRFLKRYGTHANDFKPFSDTETIQTVAQDVLRKVNARRRKGPRLTLHWYERSLLSATTEDGKLARKHWRRDCHLLIVDSLSMLDSRIARAFEALLSIPANENRRALVWLPPYTRHTMKLEELTGQAQLLVALEAAFEDWTRKPDRSIAFDTTTRVGFSRWLDQALTNLAAPPRALANNLADMEAHTGPVAISPDDMNLASFRRSR